MTSIGTGYDLANSIFSPDGRNFQVEYAIKAVENGSTSIGIRCKDGVVLAVEKTVGSKLLKPGVNKRIGTVDRHVGVAFSGMAPDGGHFIARARDEARSWRDMYKSPIPTNVLANRMGTYLHVYTCHSYVRPFGVTAIVAGFDPQHELPVDGEVGSGPSCGAGGKLASSDKKSSSSSSSQHGGPFLYMIEPSGLFWGYYGAATGKGRQTAKAELEKLDLAAGTLELPDGIKEAARILHKSHGDENAKDYEVEMTWISGLDGPTKGRHESVPQAMVDEAMRLAKQADEDEEEMEE